MTRNAGKALICIYTAPQTRPLPNNNTPLSPLNNVIISRHVPPASLLREPRTQFYIASSFLISAIANPGFRPFGHVLEQFKIV